MVESFEDLSDLVTEAAQRTMVDVHRHLWGRRVGNEVDGALRELVEPSRDSWLAEHREAVSVCGLVVAFELRLGGQARLTRRGCGRERGGESLSKY